MGFASSASGQACTYGAAVAQAATLTAAHVLHLTPSAFEVPTDCKANLSTQPARSSDPGRLLLRLAKSNKGSGATVLLAPSDPVFVSRLIPHLPALAQSSVVLHIATTSDHTPVTASLNYPGITLLHSGNAAQAQINALVATKVARQTGRAVLHFFELEDKAEVKLFNKTQVTAAKKFINADAKASNGVNGHANGINKEAEESVDYTAVTVEALVVSSYSSIPRSLGSGEAVSTHGSSSPSKIVLALGGSDSIDALSNKLPADAALLSLSLVSPLSSARLLSLVPEPVKSMVVLEQAYTRTTKIGGPLFLHVLSTFNDVEDRPEIPKIISRPLGKIGTVNAQNAITDFLECLSDSASSSDAAVGSIVPTAAYSTELKMPKHETAYTKILETTFGSRFELVNKADAALDAQGSTTIPSTLPDYALGKVLANQASKTELTNSVRSLLSNPSSEISSELKKLLSDWLANPSDASVAAKIPSLLDDTSALAHLKSQASAFAKPSQWIIGSDAWSYDLGTSGVHHALSSNANVNLLIIDSQPYDGPEAVQDAERRAKKDVGLYAMNYGNAYVASVAVYGDYSQTVRAFSEADKFDGPAIILAYLPKGDNDASKALEVLKETKLAIDSGFWPLYRWNPHKEVKRAPIEGGDGAAMVGGRGWQALDDDDAFQLDSERIKTDLRAFLDRQNILTQLALNEPKLADSIVGSFGKKIQDAVDQKAKAAFEKLSGAIDGPSLLVLYASDGGNAEKVAKRFTARARARGLGARFVVMDEFSYEDLSIEPNVALFTSTAGQGEFPNNGRTFWKALQQANPALGPSGGEGKSLDQVKFSVFGMGDSHYWPRPEDAHYYNKSSKDLDAKLAGLGAERFVDLGLGDDQDADGYQTGYKIWEAAVWKSFGVDDVKVVEAEPEPVTNEHIKIASNYLRGTIVQGLNDTSTGALAESDGQLTKFHGIYQQDDRDIREQRKEEGLEPAYSFMVRVRMPAGVCQPKQWLAIDEISDRRGNRTFKLTTRQTFQFHGIIKSNLKPAIQEINRATLDTVAACGDVNRNVMCSANPSIGPLHKQVHDFATHISEHLMPQTTAYSEIWLDQKLVAGDALKAFSEPLYGQYYLPRKFKIAIAVPPHNDVDVFCNDVGFIAIVDPATGNLQGFNVSIGGGMGVTHAMKTTYPRLGDVIGFCTPEQGTDVAEKIMLVQRDNGNRSNRKNARLKYTIDAMGLDKFVAETESRLGYKLQPAKEYKFDSNIDEFGWTTGSDGLHHCTLFIENGRVEDAPGKPQKEGLRKIAEIHKGVFRLTGNQHLIVSDVTDEAKPQIEKLLAEYKLNKFDFSGLRLSSSACVAFPTCGLAMAESERFLPGLIDQVEKIMEDQGLRNDSIVMRVTGCPNGCARPYAAEIGFVGKAPDSYLMLLGGSFLGDRLNKIYKEAVCEREIVEILTPMIKSYAKTRMEGEKFGDFVIRKDYVKQTYKGLDWYENSGAHAPVEV